ncbi:BBS1 [Symbiodinium natans]|uniref:BBS1 protein n=1 Tax=Symbiodinium natans TaxID=878477 RepID=A0A812QZX9_9DINO|nr:BBS1 [Symbiodinium natans]
MWDGDMRVTWEPGAGLGEPAVAWPQRASGCALADSGACFAPNLLVSPSPALLPVRWVACAFRQKFAVARLLRPMVVKFACSVVDVRDGLPDPKDPAPLKVVALPDDFITREEPALDDGSRRQEAAKVSASYAEALGLAVLDAAAARRWGVTKVLLQELQRAPEVLRRRALMKADVTCKTALRMCVDALSKDKPPLLQALEGSTLRVILGKTRQYWWSLHIKTVCINTFWFSGQISIGVPRSRGFHAPSDVLSRTPMASWTEPPWTGCIWSKPQECDGKLEVDPLSTFPGTEGRARLVVDGGHDASLTLRLVAPGEVAAFGHSQLRNPLSFALIAAAGIIAGKVASGACDPAACARFAAEMEESGPRMAAKLTLDLGADPRALADDGLSPYTAAILKEDPCGMLGGLDAGLRLRILRGDKTAWAEVARSAEGKGLPDIAAGALSRGLPIPESMAEELLGYCFEADLPLLALRVLARIDGKCFLMAALQRAGSLAWRRVAERIVQQARPGLKPYWLSPESLRCAIVQIQAGYNQYRLLLDSFMHYLGASEAEEFLADPCVLPRGRGGVECPICLEPLCRSTPAAFVDSVDAAVCLHLLCSNCARGYASSTNTQGEALRCPECRRHATTMKQLPSLSEDPLRWFEFLAGTSDTVSVNGKVAKSMLLRTISSILPVEADAIEAGSMGGELSQEVSASDFLTHELFVWVWRNVQEHLRCMKLGPPPDLEERRAWFKYWNLSESGRLSRAEVLRAILRSFRVSSMERRAIARQS